MYVEKINANDIIGGIKSLGNKNPETSYKCDICKDRGFVTDDEGRVGNCKCEIKRLQQQQIDRSGLGKAFRERTLDSIKINNNRL